MNVLEDFQLLVAVIAFIWHALVAYAETTQGTAELQAIEAEWAKLEGNPQPQPNVSSPVSTRIQAAREKAANLA